MDQREAINQQILSVRTELMATRAAHSTVLAEEINAVRREAMEEVRKERGERLAEATEIRVGLAAVREGFSTQARETKQVREESVAAQCETVARAVEEECAVRRAMKCELQSAIEMRMEESSALLHETCAQSRQALHSIELEREKRSMEMAEVRNIVSGLQEMSQQMFVTGLQEMSQTMSDDVFGRCEKLARDLDAERGERCLKDEEISKRMQSELGRVDRRLEDHRNKLEEEVEKFGLWLGEQHAALENAIGRELAILRASVDPTLQQPPLAGATVNGWQRA